MKERSKTVSNKFFLLFLRLPSFPHPAKSCRKPVSFFQQTVFREALTKYTNSAIYVPDSEFGGNCFVGFHIETFDVVGSIHHRDEHRMERYHHSRAHEQTFRIALENFSPCMQTVCKN